MLAPALAQRTVALIALGRSAEASELVDEVLALPPTISAFIDLAWALSDLGRGARIRTVRRADTYSTRGAPRRSPIAAGRFEAAADALEDVGDVSDEAYARLRSGNDDQVRRAARLLPLRRRDAVHRGGRGAAPAATA